MLPIVVMMEPERWDEEKEEFVNPEYTTLQLEHSLISISKWESKWHKPFLSKKEKTSEETIDYIRCMTITQNVSPIVYSKLSSANIQEINAYINDSMTATFFSENKKKSSKQVIVTSEVIYYWMIVLRIPMECQKWHLNRLLTLIKVCNEKNAPTKKMSRDEIISRNVALNEERKRKMNTKG